MKTLVQELLTNKKARTKKKVEDLILVSANETYLNW